MDHDKVNLGRILPENPDFHILGLCPPTKQTINSTIVMRIIN
jgi:hypothetical protein